LEEGRRYFHRRAKLAMQTLLLMLDLCGTFVFAVSGAVAANHRRLDLFGVMVLAFLAGNFGGILRDVLIGAIPPAAINDWRYLAVSAAAGLMAFFWSSLIDRLRRPVLIFDAAGLALFAVSGTQKALDFGLPPVMAIFLGALSGIGGGLARDVLLAQIPSVLQSDFYAMAALIGAALVVVGELLQLPPPVVAPIAVVICFAVRVTAIYRGWRLPIARQP
jgi:uncharacterized membrane protein YeiH